MNVLMDMSSNKETKIMYPLSSEGLNIETEKAIYFFTTAFYPLDNFSAHTIYIWDRNFPTVEHAFQWKKFSIVQPEISQRILESNSPHSVKRISDANKTKQPISWQNERVEVMQEILRAKAAQHEDVREALRKTGKREIVENSPVDNFWGIGPNKDGQNMTGKIWMKIRDLI